MQVSGRLHAQSLYALQKGHRRPLDGCDGLNVVGTGKIIPVLNLLSTMPRRRTFLTSVLDVGECSASRPSRFTPGETALSAHGIGGSMSPRTGLHAMKKVC
jgi:hypothetical protein